VAIIHLTDQDFQEKVAQSSGVILVDFWAPWCPPCQMLTPILEELDEELKGKIQVAKLNVDENPQTARQFNVMSIPNLIIFKDGQKVGQIIAFQTKENLKKAVQKHL
jgi:thioredoxin 1